MLKRLICALGALGLLAAAAQAQIQNPIVSGLMPRIIQQSGAVVDNTGLRTTNTNLASIAYPAMKANDALRISVFFDTTGSVATNTKTFLVRYGPPAAVCTPLAVCSSGTIIFTQDYTTAAAVSGVYIFTIQNVNATNAQAFMASTNPSPNIGSNSAAVAAGAVDTSAGGFVNLNCTTATATTDHCTLKGYTLELLPGS